MPSRPVAPDGASPGTEPLRRYHPRPVPTGAAAVITLASAVNLVLVGSAALGMTWVLPRVARGQLSSMPPGVRTLYAGLALLMVVQVVLAWRAALRPEAPRGAVRALLWTLSATYLASSLLNALSRSPDERWNALPALALAGAFLVLARQRREPIR